MTIWTRDGPGVPRPRPKLVIDKDGKERLLVEEQILGSQQGMGGIGGLARVKGSSRPRR
ncbi:MAG TPA: hypothetical protein VEQ62_03870 [Stellaceae bacterium]|jgi:hypothetical protein|nr:hypothetical protein [Stellaceae bacterium]